MSRWKVWSPLACVLLALAASPAGAEDRGEAGSDQRDNYCARRQIDCAKSALEECRKEYSSAEDIDRCDRVEIEVCNKSWGGRSDCSTRAEEGTGPTVPTRPPGNTQSPTSRPPSRIVPPV